MSATSARVSVVIPVHRAEECIGDCLAAIAAQELPPLEVVLVHERAEVASIAAATAAADRLGLVAQVVEIPDGSGIGSARNRGVARARGNLIWFCDADDTADPRMLALLAARIERDRSAYAICRTLIVEDDRSHIDEPIADDAVWSGAEVARAQLNNRLRAYACNRLLPLELVRAHPFVEDLFYEDYDAALAMALASERVSLCAEALYYYRRHGGSVSKSFSHRTVELLEQERRVEAVLARHPGAVDDLERLRYRYEGVILPVANLASRSPEHPDSARALRRASRSVRLSELWRLARGGQRRMAVVALELRLSWRAYAAVLRRR